MIPAIWGKHAWNFIHLVTMEYPENPTEKDMRDYYNFIYSLKDVLPCSTCRNNLATNLQKHPLTYESLSSRANFVKWAIDLHNIVNIHTKKPILSYDQAMDEINKLMNGVTGPVEKNKSGFSLQTLAIAIFVVIIICILIFLLVKKKIEFNSANY